ncbi:mCpol domain-containing protein [Paenibacillus sp. V4I7]|uniref:mCpol domain-containing protein n=1 Tax=Paenibacillus sp. V4I7 TaxID=3042307 RepID=UPI00278517C4|nr:mCpol domain-containing protein [Paenibacillus sp. V4I7]MDQ0897504.1 hypothetical protein [Paenibacillus sp. V4I7]
MFRYYIRLDADNIGDRIEYHLLCGDLENAKEVHMKVQNSMIILKDVIKENGDFELLMNGCDDFFIGTKVSDLTKIREFTDVLRNKFNLLTNETISAGIGSSITEAIINLMKAKAAGKNRIIE